MIFNLTYTTPKASPITERDIVIALIAIRPSLNFSTIGPSTTLNQIFGKSLRWRSYKKDLRKLSKLFPKVYFRLKVDGAKQFDFFDGYVINPESQEKFYRL